MIFWLSKNILVWRIEKPDWHTLAIQNHGNKNNENFDQTVEWTKLRYLESTMENDSNKGRIVKYCDWKWKCSRKSKKTSKIIFAKRSCFSDDCAIRGSNAVVLAWTRPVVWKKLADQFQKTWANKLALQRKLCNLKLKDGQSTQKHIKMLTEIFDELSIIGDPLDEEIKWFTYWQAYLNLLLCWWQHLKQY